MDRRVTGLALIAIGIALSLLGTFSHDWYSSAGVSIGLRELEACGYDGCRSLSLQDMPVDSLFSMSGNVAYFAAIIAGVLALVTGALALARQPMPGSVSPARLAVAFYGAAVLGGLIFLATKPDDAQLTMGMAPLLAIGGAAIGGVGTLLLALEDHRNRSSSPTPIQMASLPGARALPASVSPPAPAPSAGEMTPACPQCRAPLEWETAHGRWFCTACNAYPRR